MRVVVDGLVKRYPQPGAEAVHAVGPVDAAFAPGRLTVVAGASGCGKSTLLRQLALIERPTFGSITFDEKPVEALSARAARRLRRGAISYLFQRPTDNLVHGFDVGGQLRLAAELAGAPRPDVTGRLGMLGLEHLADANPFRLSGGEQQRVALACALAAEAGLVVADEPTSQLDHASASAVVESLYAVALAGATVVVASHDPVVIARSDDVLRLERAA
jgi:putative ABC transport system ATP-binding protein/macrolide transport system ATP-binding/permease protein